MEESLGWMELLGREFQLKDVDIRTYSPLTLAYLGDGVYELVVRTVLVKRGNCPVRKLHKRASALSCAAAQSQMAKALKSMLTPEEYKIYKRGRNAHPSTMPKNAAPMDYLAATGLEALVGWLYLAGQWERLIQLIGAGIRQLGDK